MKRSFLKSAVELVTCGLVVFGAGHAYADQQKLPSGTPYDQIGQKIEDYYKEHEKTSAGLATSVFEWGSTTKIMVWVSVMQLWEEGKLDLNDDIKEYLPKDFLTNLKYDKPINMLDLMNHQESFDETPLYMGSDKSLEELLKENQPPQSYKPGELTAYSNYGTALAGYIVERVSGQSFADYVYEHIFQPLGMEHTALKPDLSDNTFVKEQRKSEKAYDTNGKSMGLTPFEVGLYPAGRATGTLADIKKFAQALLSKEKLFKRAETWETFYSPTNTFPHTDIPINAHGLWSIEYENTRTLGHGGNTTGFTTSLLLDFKTGVGSVIMVNQGLETNFTSKIPELIYGQKKSTSQEQVKNFQPGFYRMARTFNQGPLSLMKMMPNYTTYIKNPNDNPNIQSRGFWIAGEKHGRYVISLPISDWVKMSIFDVVKDYGVLILAAVAVFYALLAYIGGFLVKMYRLIFRNPNQQPANLVWNIWHYVTAVFVLIVPVNFVTALSSIQATASTAGSRLQFILFAVIGLVLVVSTLLPVVWRSAFKSASKARIALTLATSSAAFIMAFNIFYWSLYQWWTL